MLKSLQIESAFLFILALGLFAMAARPVTDPDVWWHLKTGELILHTHHIFRADPYSFTRAGQLWVNHEWLSEVLLFAIYRVTGFTGLIILFAAITAGAFFLAYRRCSGPAYLAALFTVWGAAACASIWGVRPQILSLLLTSIFLLVLDRSFLRPRLLWWLPPLTLLWVNLHAGYALGIALIGLFLFGTLLDTLFGFEKWSAIKPHIQQFGFAFLACLAVVPLNPNGLRMYSYPWQTLSSQAMQQFIQEWASPNFHQGLYLPLLLMILALLAGLAFSPKRLRPLDLLLLAVTLYGAMRSVRHIPVFALVAIPILCRVVAPLFQQNTPPKAELRSNPKLAFNGIVILFVIFFAVVRINSVIRSQARAEANNFPAAAINFLATHNSLAPVMNHYNWGGYFIWKLYPQYQVFVDGRADVYGDNFLNRLADMYYLKNNWKQKFEATNVCSVMLPPDAPLIAALRERNNWKMIYTDKQATILTRTTRCLSANLLISK
ncbi:MAG TPA: hypothetical protein VGF44_04045 [Terriglobales bacterium]